MLSEIECREIARSLLDAGINRVPIMKPSQTHPALEMADAYRIQDFWAEAKTRNGARLIGHKIGLTSRAMQRIARIAEPDYGRIFSDAVYGDGSRIEASLFIQARVEMELAFIMEDGLDAADAQLYDVLRAIEFVVPALEISDFRTPMPRTIADTVADNAAFGAIVVGSPVPPGEVNLRWVQERRHQGKRTLRRGHGTPRREHRLAGQ
jgi:2-oxo-hept-3-ene-1,7-dioate hydratase